MDGLQIFLTETEDPNDAFDRLGYIELCTGFNEDADSEVGIDELDEVKPLIRSRKYSNDGLMDTKLLIMDSTKKTEDERYSKPDLLNRVADSVKEEIERKLKAELELTGGGLRFGNNEQPDHHEEDLEMIHWLHDTDIVMMNAEPPSASASSGATVLNIHLPMESEPDGISMTAEVDRTNYGYHSARPSQSSSSQSGPSSETQRKGRVLMDAVVVPTFAALQSTRAKGRQKEHSVKVEKSEPKIKLEPVSEEDKVKLEALRNPDIKIKNGIGLAKESINYRLHLINMDPYIINIPPEIKAAKVTRMWMSNTFGGSPRGVNPPVDTKRFKHGLNDFCYLTYQYNPDAPQKPGYPGLKYHISEPAHDDGKVGRIIARIKANEWQYLGQYIRVPAPPLTPEEWRSQSESFRNYWAKRITTRTWGLKLRMKVELRRRLGREPTEDEFEEETQNPTKGDYKHITPEMVKAAFDVGEEEMTVYCIQCIGYDVEFQRKLATMPKGWTPPQKKTSKSKSKSEKKGKKVQKDPQRSKGSSKKRKRNETSSEEEDEPRVDTKQGTNAFAGYTGESELSEVGD